MTSIHIVMPGSFTTRQSIDPFAWGKGGVTVTYLGRVFISGLWDTDTMNENDAGKAATRLPQLYVRRSVIISAFIGSILPTKQQVISALDEVGIKREDSPISVDMLRRFDAILRQRYPIDHESKVSYATPSVIYHLVCRYHGDIEHGDVPGPLSLARQRSNDVNTVESKLAGDRIARDLNIPDSERRLNQRDMEYIMRYFNLEEKNLQERRDWGTGGGGGGAGGGGGRRGGAVTFSAHKSRRRKNTRRRSSRRTKSVRG